MSDQMALHIYVAMNPEKKHSLRTNGLLLVIAGCRMKKQIRLALNSPVVFGDTVIQN